MKLPDYLHPGNIFRLTGHKSTYTIVALHEDSQRQYLNIQYRYNQNKAMNTYPVPYQAIHDTGCLGLVFQKRYWINPYTNPDLDDD